MLQNKKSAVVSTPSLLAKWKRNQNGSTAIEFGFIAVPFMTYLFAIIGYGLHFYTQSVLDRAVDIASRQIATGQAAQRADSMEDFKNNVCFEASQLIDCDKVRIHIVSGASWANVNPPSCLTNSQQLKAEASGNPSVQSQAGSQLSAVLVTLCYEWDLAAVLPFLGLGNMQNGSALIQSIAAFKSEPYGTAGGGGGGGGGGP